METTYYSIPACVTDWLRQHGYPNPWGQMASYINGWEALLRADGDFWDYSESDGERTYKVHRRSVKPARRVCDEWASLILNEDTVIATEDETCTDWLQAFLHDAAFQTKGQELVSDSMSLGTAAWTLWYDADASELKIRRYDARMILPLTWDEDGITECAFATAAVVRGELFNQLQLHVKGEGGTYEIRTVLFDADGHEREVEGVLPSFETGCETPTFAIVRPAIKNRLVDFSPYGQSIIAGHEDVLKSVDLAYDAIFNEVDLAKMRVFVADTLLEFNTSGDGKKRVIPFGKNDATIYRKVMSTDDVIHEYAPAMRTEAQLRAYRLAVQTMGDECGFGVNYFDIDKAGGIRTAKEVSADSSALMRNVKRHENVVGAAIVQLCRAILHFGRTFMGAWLPDEGQITVNFDDSIITDTMTEKQNDLAEVAAGVMPKWEYRVKWYGDSEEHAREMVKGEPQAFDLMG